MRRLGNYGRADCRPEHNYYRSRFRTNVGERGGVTDVSSDRLMIPLRHCFARVRQPVACSFFVSLVNFFIIQRLSRIYASFVLISTRVVNSRATGKIIIIIARRSTRCRGHLSVAPGEYCIFVVVIFGDERGRIRVCA